MPSLWDATGDWSQLQACVDYWLAPEVVALVQKHEEYLIVNIANEAGDGSVTDAQFRTAYESAITSLRAAGIHTPLAIDAAGWGRGEDYILDNAQYLLDVDPDHNLLFSWHPWDPISWNGTQARIKATIDSAIAKNICFIVGEFSHVGVNYTEPIEWEYIMQYGHENEIGWLPWVWWCCSDSYDLHTMSADKTFGNWANSPWGESVAISHTYSIQNTAVRTDFITNLSCPSGVVPSGLPRSSVSPVDNGRGETFDLTGARVRRLETVRGVHLVRPHGGAAAELRIAF
jgi:mannan endo-1,4-beta-mannosidase